MRAGRPTRGRRTVPAVAITFCFLASACTSSGEPPSASSSTSASPVDPVYSTVATMSDPVPGSPSQPRSLSSAPLPADYVEQEFFASGTASAFSGEQTTDGLWTVTPTTKADYKTRLLVRRPAEADRFNGTVVVEWMNESSNESIPDWGYLSPMLTDEGYAYVAVSAQALPIEGGAGVGFGQTVGLTESDPERYGSLEHPGEEYSFDVFAQIARALRAGDALGGLKPKHVVATGESQSTAFLTTFNNALQPHGQPYDGVFIHSRGGGTVKLDGSDPASGGSPLGQLIRTDLTAPVFQFETESDVGFLTFASARQPDSDSVRTWEVAGTAHGDAYAAGDYAGQLGCDPPINDGPQHEVIQAAFVAFTRWVAADTSPPTATPLALKGTNKLERDTGGNAVGGVRTPAVDVPVAALSGEPPSSGSVVCLLLGSTKAYPPARLQKLYGSKADYLADYEVSLDKAIDGGFIRSEDRAGLLQEAATVRFR